MNKKFDEKEFEKKEKEELTKEAEQKQAEKVVDLVNKALKDAGMKEIPQKKSIDKQGDKVDDKDKDKALKKEDEVDNFPSIYVPRLPDNE